MIDPITTLSFAVYENRGAYAVLLGSGVSRSAQIPTGWEITIDLIRRVGSLEGAGKQTEWADWYSKKFHREPSYSDLLDQLSSSAEERRSILHSYIEASPEEAEEGVKVPTPAHKALASLVKRGFIRVILTTNFDRLMETALRQAGVEPTVISSDDHLRGAVPLIHSRCYLVKLHGDYLDTRIKNTSAELAVYSSEMNALLDRILDEHGLIVSGWSGEWDEALRSAIMRAPNRRFSTYWMTRSPPKAAAKDLMSHRAARLIENADANEFFVRLEQQVRLQDSLKKQHPESIDLLLASAKKFVPRPEHRIELDELVGETRRQLATRLRENGFGTSGQWSPLEYRERVASYEAASEPLVRVLGVLGRWGGAPQYGLAVEALDGLTKEESLGGLVAWINLRTLPAVLAVYGFGLGALKGRQFDALYRWLAHPVVADGNEPEPIVDAFFLERWKGGARDIWQNMFDQEPNTTKKTPLSDHLNEVLKVWTRDYIFGDEEFDILFSTFEFLAAAVSMTLSISKNDLTDALASQSGSGFVWVPVGRALWQRNVGRTVVHTLSIDPTRSELLAAGFAKGDREFLEMIVKNIQRVWAQRRW